MEDDLGLHRLQQRSDVVGGDVEEVQVGGAGDLLAAAPGEVVDHSDGVAVGEQGVDEGGADEAGPAGDHDVHTALSSISGAGRAMRTWVMAKMTHPTTTSDP